MKIRTNLNVFVVMSVVLLAITSATADIITVGPNGTGEYPTIQAAIDASYNGDTVILAPGTYTGNGNRDIDFLAKAITVKSKNGPEGCIIDCQGTKVEPHRGFYFHSGECENSVIDGLTITNGHAINGGGICCESSSPTINNCIIIGNRAQANGGSRGGGIYCISASPIVSNCSIASNTALSVIYSPSDQGGGLYGCDGSIINCTITGNRANYGGGGLASCNGMVYSCIISENEAGTYGAGLHSCSGIISNCTITRNGRSSYPSIGGGLANCMGEIINCTISDNLAGGSGGGLADCDIIISNCNIIGNYAYDYGGGLYRCRGTITSCTFSDNTAARYGGAICSRGYFDVTIKNCILWSNTASYGNEIALKDNVTINVNYCDIEGGQGDINNDGSSTLNWFNGNIDADPLFVDTNSDFHLLPDSPCIDAGDPDYVAGPNETDLDGNPRIVNGIVDMGAFEAQLRDPVELLLDLAKNVINLNLQQGISNSLDSKLQAAMQALDDINENNNVAAINTLEAFISAVEAQRGNKIPEADADALIAVAQEIIDLLTAE